MSGMHPGYELYSSFNCIILYDGSAESEISENILNDSYCTFIAKEVCVSNTTEDIFDAF
jgi:hypothetical protein